MEEMGRCGAPPRPRSVVRSAAAILVSIAVLAPLAACGSSDDAQATPATQLDDDVITVGSFDFTESAVLAEVYSQGLEAAGYRVQREFSLGAREFVGSALATGLVEFLPEYAGTAAEFYSLGTAEPSDDVVGTHAELVRALQGKNMLALDAAPAQDANTFVVTHSTATRLHLAKLSDLQPVAGRLTFGGPPECPTRRQCLAGLIDLYGLKFGQIVTVDAGGPLTHNALQEGLVDVALLFSTDPSIGGKGLVELDDDRGLQPAESITPLVRSEIVDRLGPGLVSVINAISARLTTGIVRELNGAAGLAGATVASVATAWWSEVNG
jgi:osmoprotectant transport system substrate-binding protein